MSDLSYELILNNVKNGVNFSWSRWGDGEWSAVLGVRGKNTDKHEYFPDMGNRLVKVLKDKPKYYIGLQNLAKRTFEDNNYFQILTKDLEWSNNEILHRASIGGDLNRFFDVLKNKRVILVGNSHLKKMNIYTHFVEIPLINCWNHYKQTLINLQQIIRPNSIVLYCASMMSNVLIDDLYSEDITQIDCGSVFDPYVGRNTRRYHSKLRIG